MTLTQLRDNNLIVYECLSGSHAYGLATPESDIDIKGVFILPEAAYFGLHTIDQVSDATNNIVYYELTRFVELLAKSNPTILELLYTPTDCIRKIHPAFESLRAKNFLSKQCQNSFGGYALTQMKKARGLNKKILNPVAKERKRVLDFCYVTHQQGSIPIMQFMALHGLQQENCGLARISHMPETYGLYYGDNRFKGIISKASANDISLSSIPKSLKPIAFLYFNKPAYSKYCQDYQAYWEWVAERNEARYQNTVQHGKNYDAKNMMHTFRLLNMCEEIGKYGQLKVRRSDYAYLLEIKTGKFQYDELLRLAEDKIKQIADIYQNTALPEEPDVKALNDFLVKTRQSYYNNT